MKQKTCSRETKQLYRRNLQLPSNLTCIEFAIVNMYWNTMASSLIAKIPKIHVTPRTGISVHTLFKAFLK